MMESVLCGCWACNSIIKMNFVGSHFELVNTLASTLQCQLFPSPGRLPEKLPNDDALEGRDLEILKQEAKQSKGVPQSIGHSHMSSQPIYKVALGQNRTP